METIEKPAFRLIGLKLKTKTVNENNQSMKDCGELWQKFENEKIAVTIPDKSDDAVYAVYFDYEKDETKPFAYFIGCRVDENALLPQGLDDLWIPAQDYKQFTARGVMTGCVTDTWQKIWNSDTKRKFAFDFEVYDERSRDWSNAAVDIFISVTR